MEPYTKKRRSNEGLAPITATVGPSPYSFTGTSPLLTKDDVLCLIESLSRDQLAEIVASVACHGGPALDLVRSLCSRDPAQRKLFIRGLGWETTQESLRSVFTPYGELEEAVVITDKISGRSKGYGFITFRYIDGAILALKDPSKKIDGRITVVQLASPGLSEKSAPNSAQKAADLALRKIFVGNVLPDMSSERLLSHFSTYGEIEEGPLGFDKQTGKFRGFALFVYKTVSGAQAALANPNKVFDGNTLVCKLAGEGKKGKAGGTSEPGLVGPTSQSQTGVLNSDVGVSGIGLSLPGQYGGLSAGLSSYAGSGTGLSSYGGSGAGMSSYGGTGTITGNSSYGRFPLPGSLPGNPGHFPLPGSLPGNPGHVAPVASLNPANTANGLGLGALRPGAQYGGVVGLGLSSGSGLNSGSGMLAKMGLGNLSSTTSALLGVNPGVGMGGGFVDVPFRGPDGQMQVGLGLPAGASARIPGRPGLYPNLPPY
jgi:heterogeneous nuclear ribonucleoprotein A1/A3